ncbi:MAG: serine hydrolase [Anaerolineae bacterium]
MRQSRSGCGFLVFFLLSIAILSGTWFYTTWQSSEKVLPPDLTINGIPMSGMTREQALLAIEQAYTVPITVTYNGETIPPLLPEMIELRLDMEATTENLDEAITTGATPQDFIRYVAGQLLQREPETTEVNAVVLYSRERVNAFLDRIAQKYDHPPMDPVPLPEAGTFRPAVEGTQLNVESSLPLLIDAILAADPDDRQVALVVDIESPPRASVDILEQALTTSLGDFGGVPGIFAKHLNTGQELCLNCNVAYAGLSTLKVGIALETYRLYDSPLDPELGSLMRSMLTESDNAAANLLLSEIGGGDPYTGALQVTDFLWSLGLGNTYLVAPYDLKEGVPPPDIVTSANSRTDVDTDPDPYIQTTPMEAGLLMESIYQCTYGGGTLRALYPKELAPIECEELLAWMERNQINSLLGEGMPPETKVVHKHGWRGDTHADVSLVYASKSDFILVAFLYQPEWLVWEESVPTFSQIGELTYRFFNGQPQALAER